MDRFLGQGVIHPYFIVPVVFVHLCMVFVTTPTAQALSDSRVTVSQQILTGTCYDTASQTQSGTDYIAVWECEIQR